MAGPNTNTDLAEVNPAILATRAFALANRPDASQEAGDTLALVLREYPNALPNAEDFAGASVDTAISLVQGTPAVRAVLRHSVDRLKASLGYAKADRIERLLIEQIAICYLRQNVIEQSYEQVMSSAEHTMAQGSYWEKRLSSVQRRYLRAVETLARVRKLLGRPAVQVNIATHGGQQVVQNAAPGPT